MLRYLKKTEPRKNAETISEDDLEELYVQIQYRLLEAYGLTEAPQQEQSVFLGTIMNRFWFLLDMLRDHLQTLPEAQAAYLVLPDDRLPAPFLIVILASPRLLELLPGVARDIHRRASELMGQPDILDAAIVPDSIESDDM